MYDKNSEGLSLRDIILESLENNKDDILSLVTSFIYKNLEDIRDPVEQMRADIEILRAEIGATVNELMGELGKVRSDLIQLKMELDLAFGCRVEDIRYRQQVLPSIDMLIGRIGQVESRLGTIIAREI